MRAWRRPLGAVMLAGILGSGCDRGLAPASNETAALKQVQGDVAPVGSVSTRGQAPAAPSTAGAFAALKLIRSAEIAVEVPAYDAAAQQVAGVAERLGGYVAAAQATRGPNGKKAGSLTIRVPAARFNEALAALHGLGTLRSENVATQDVTREYADLETRLQVKRDTSTRLRELLRARTADLPDVLTAERELARVTEEIERMEGERRFYDHQVALSSLTLTLSEPQALVEPSVFAPLGRALRDSASVLVQSLAALLYLLVALAPWLAVLFVIWKIARAVYRRRKAPAQA